MSEDNLKNCGPKLKEFTDKEGIDPPKFPVSTLVGASSSSQSTLRYKIENFADLNKIIEMIKSRTKQRYQDVINIRYLTEPEGIDFFGGDSIIIVSKGLHAFVLCHLERNCQVFIADGENCLFNDKDEDGIAIRNMIKTAFITPVKFLAQSGVDHCGSSAVVIGIQFIKNYASGIWTETIVPERWTHNRVKATLHKVPSASLEKGSGSVATAISIAQRANFRCPSCSKRFFKRAGFTQHVNACKGKDL